MKGRRLHLLRQGIKPNYHEQVLKYMRNACKLSFQSSRSSSMFECNLPYAFNQDENTKAIAILCYFQPAQIIFSVRFQTVLKII